MWKAVKINAGESVLRGNPSVQSIEGFADIILEFLEETEGILRQHDGGTLCLLSISFLTVVGLLSVPCLSFICLLSVFYQSFVWLLSVSCLFLVCFLSVCLSLLSSSTFIIWWADGALPAGGPSDSTKGYKHNLPSTRCVCTQDTAANGTCSSTWVLSVVAERTGEVRSNDRSHTPSNNMGVKGERGANEQTNRHGNATTANSKKKTV